MYMYVGGSRRPRRKPTLPERVALSITYMRNGLERESNPQPQWWQALMLISNIDLTTAPLWQPLFDDVLVCFTIFTSVIRSKYTHAIYREYVTHTRKPGKTRKFDICVFWHTRLALEKKFKCCKNHVSILSRSRDIQLWSTVSSIRFW
jgi:hypothetical protein